MYFTNTAKLSAPYSEHAVRCYAAKYCLAFRVNGKVSGYRISMSARAKKK